MNLQTVSRSLLVLLILVTSAQAQQNQGQQNQNARGQNFRGIVYSAAADGKSFAMVDRSGNVMTVRVSPGTAYDLNRAAAGFADVARLGMDVRGSFAPDGSASQVSARGIVDEVEVEQMQPFMGASDEEWAFLRPKIEKVQALQRQADGEGGGNNNQNNAGNLPQRNIVQEMEESMQRAFFNQGLSPEQLNTNLRALREARIRAKQELAAARVELTNVLSVRQEVLLVMMGILE